MITLVLFYSIYIIFIVGCTAVISMCTSFMAAFHRPNIDLYCDPFQGHTVSEADYAMIAD